MTAQGVWGLGCFRNHPAGSLLPNKQCMYVSVAFVTLTPMVLLREARSSVLSRV